MGGREVRVVVDRDRVLAVAARRLDGDEHVAEVEPGEHEVVAVEVALAGRRAPRLDHGVAQRVRERREPARVVGDRQPRAAPRASCVVREELLVVAAGGDQRVDRARRRRRSRARRGSRPPQRVAAAPSRWPACRARRRCRAGVLGREGGEHDRGALLARGRASAAGRGARPAARAGRSARRRARSAGARASPSSSGSLNENGTPMMRPSNSGIATCIAASSGVRPASDASQRCRDVVAHSAWMTGTSSASSASACHSSPACEPPLASTVVISASISPSSSSSAGRVAAQRVAPHGRRLAAGALDRAAHSASTNAVFPVTTVRAVEDDADARAAVGAGRLDVAAPGRRRRASGSSRGGSKPWPSRPNVSARKRSSSRVLSTPPWRRYSKACATAPGGRGESAVSSASGSASPPSRISATPSRSHSARSVVDALGPRAPAAQQPHDDDLRAVDERARRHRRSRVRRRAPAGSPAASSAHGVRRGEDLGVGGRQETEQGSPAALFGSTRR